MMIPLLIGALSLTAALRVRSPPRLGRWVRWPAVGIALLALLALAGARTSVNHYRFTLLGVRYRVVDPQQGVVRTPLRIAGDDRTADVEVPGLGKLEVARLVAVGDSAVDSVRVETAPDVPAVIVVYHPRSFGRSPEPRVLGGARFGPGDTLRVRAHGEVRRFTLRTRGVLQALAGAPRYAIVDTAGREVPLAGSPGTTVFQRTYPLTDVLSQTDSTFAAGVPLGSFFYFARKHLHFVDLDSEVEGGPAPSDLVWSRESGGRRMLVAGLAYRDFPDLSLPERYGIRPLRSGRVRVNGPWLDFSFASPEVRTFGQADLEALTLPPLPREGDPDQKPRDYSIRLSPESDNFARRAVTFTSPPARAAAQAHAIFRLPLDPEAKRFRVLGPGGTAEVAAGIPFALEDGRRGLLVRVDGQALSVGGWLLFALLLAGPVVLLVANPLPPATSVLALVALGFAALRLLLGLSAHLEFPFSQESLQIALWLVPLLPWAVVLAGEDPPTASRSSGLHLAYAGWTLFLTWTLFAEAGLPKRLMLAAVPVGLWICFRHPRFVPRPDGGGAPDAGTASGAGPGATAPERRGFFQAWRRAAVAWPAASTALLLLLVRWLLDGLGQEESISLGTTRLALSAFYTPGSLLLLARAMTLHGRRLAAAAAAEPGGYGRALLRSLADLLAFPMVAYAGTAAVVSDFGIALISLPGTLVFLGIWLRAWATPRGATRAALRLAALPLAVFVLLQGAPELLLRGPESRGSEARLQRWSNNRLRLVERGDPEVLRQIGQRRSEALGIMAETMRSYTRGNWRGDGFLHGTVSPELRSTATQEHVASAFLAAQWGLAGVTGVLLLLFASLRPVGAFAPTRLTGAFTPLGEAALTATGLWLVARVLTHPLDRVLVGGALAAVAVWSIHRLWNCPGPPADPGRARTDATSFPLLTAGLFLFTFAAAGVYMVLANYGVVFFTGKNIYLLGLDSVSDVFESLALLCGAAWALRAASSNLHSASDRT